MRIVLASASPRRQELLRAMGIEFDSQPVDIDEAAVELAYGGPPQTIALKVARAKADACERGPGRLVIAADTVVTLDGVSLGKPANEEHALDMLTRLAGRTHEVTTAVVVEADDFIGRGSSTTRVTMRSSSLETLAAYVQTGDSLDKAGGYGIQSGAGPLVETVDGCYLTVVGFPACLVAELLTRAGYAGPVVPQDICEALSGTLTPRVSPHPEYATAGLWIESGVR